MVADKTSVNTHLYCLAVQAGVYNDVVECWRRMLEVPGSILGRGKRCLAYFHLLDFIMSFKGP